MTGVLALDRQLRLLALLALLLLLFVVVSPFLMMTFNALKTEAELYAHGPLRPPTRLDLSNLIETWIRLDYWNKLLNSLVISLGAAFLGVTLSVLNAYALAMGRVRARTLLLLLFVLAITLPHEALAYPLYYFYRAIGLYNTRLGLVLIMAALHSAYGTYLLTSVFNAFNREILDAAVIDGCSKLQLLLRIVVPLSMPSISVLMVFFFIWTWNEFFLPLILLVSNAKQTIPLATAIFQTQHGTFLTKQSASAFLGVFPCIVFFVLFQRTLTKGITVGSVR